MAEHQGVRATHKEYTEMLPVWEMCSDVTDGQRAVHKAGVRYLPKNGAESDTDYKARLKRSDFFNASWRTIAGLVGMAFRKDPSVIVPAAIEPYLADIDLAGTPLYSLAKDLVEDVLEYGRLGILVDHPPMPENVSAISVATAEMLGLRPSIQIYDAESIINWRYVRIANKMRLSLVVLKEEAAIPDGEFAQKTEDRYRALDLDPRGLYRQRVFRINERGEDDQVGEDIYPLMNNRPMTEIPFRIVGVNGSTMTCDEPPLIDLFDANIAHYQVNSDIRVAMHFGVPTLCISGYAPAEGETITVGSRTAIILPDPNAKVYFAEPSGPMLPEMRAALKEIEQRMAILGARMIADETKHAETLGATQIKRQGENSILSAIVLSVSDVLTWALGVMAQWSGASGEVVYEISREFTAIAMDAQQLTAIVAAYQSGALSEAEMFDLFQRGDVIDGAKSLDEHQAEVEMGGVPRPAAVAA